MKSTPRLKRQKTAEDWTEGLVAADLVLAPAACYPVYPIAAARGTVPDGGWLFDVASDCFRHEPSEKHGPLPVVSHARICGASARRNRFRNSVTPGSNAPRASPTASRLSYTVDVANDPFFGRVGAMMAASQLSQSLKFELLVPVVSEEKPTACMSFNYHREHFGEVWGLHNKAGDVLHTGCVAFGMDRLAVALFAMHGADVRVWPQAVLDALKL